MKKLWIGCLFVLLSFDIHIEDSTIGLIPDFVGYILLVMGLKELSAEQIELGKLNVIAGIMAVCSAILYISNICAIPLYAPIFFNVINVLKLIFNLYIVYQIIGIVNALERKYGSDFNSVKIMNAWSVMLCANVLLYLTMVLIPIAAIVCIIVELVSIIYFLVQFYKTTDLFWNCKCFSDI